MPFRRQVEYAKCQSKNKVVQELDRVNTTLEGAKKQISKILKL